MTKGIGRMNRDGGDENLNNQAGRFPSMLMLEREVRDRLPWDRLIEIMDHSV